MLTEEEIGKMFYQTGGRQVRAHQLARLVEQATAKRCADLAREYLNGTGADVARAIEAEFKPR